MTGIGFFAPFPLALMIPFMAGQSLAMGEAFGKGFQYGKRKISSMDNASFNKLDFKGLSESIATDYKVMIPSMEQSIRASDKLQSAVIQEMGDLIKSIPMEILNFLQSATTGGTTSTSASQLGSIFEVRSGGRGVTVNQEALEQLRKIQEAAIITGPGSPLKKPTTQGKTAKQLEIERIQRIQQAKAKEAQLEALRKRQTVISSRRQAGQSQYLERTRLIKEIARLSAKANDSRLGSAVQAVMRSGVVRVQIKLENLIARYKF